MALLSARIGEREEQVFLLLTILIGALVGLAVVGFILLTEHLGSRFYPANGSPWRRVLIPVAGSLAMGFLLARYFPQARGSGVPQTKAALFGAGGRISLRTVLGKFFCTSATLACGIPLGREGPSVQVGAGIASLLGRWLHLSEEKVKALLPVGCAAAIAAAFNTPLAAVLFSLEELMGDLHAPLLGSVVLSSATSWIVLRLLLGNEPLFHVPQYTLVHPVEFLIYAALGVAGGLVSLAFVKLLLGLRARFLRLPASGRWLHPLAGGLLVGVLGWFVPQVLGVGYIHVSQALNGDMVLKTMALLVALKLVAVAVSYASGNAGGIFGPSLFLGAMLGGAVGSVAHHLLPAYTATPGAYALVGMGALFAGIVRAPMTSVVMIFETTRDYSIVVPLMIANLISFFLSARWQKEPIYDVLAHQDGIHLPLATTRERLGKFRVAQAMRLEPEVLDAQMTVQAALERAGRGEIRAWPMVNRVSGEVTIAGVVSSTQLSHAAAGGSGARKLAELFASDDFPHVHSDHSLQHALARMGEAALNALPVVSRMNVHKLEAVIVLSDILEAYGLESPTEAEHPPPRLHR